MLPVCHLQGKTTEGHPGKYCGNPSPGTSWHWLLSLEPGKGKEENILVVTDHFTWYVQVYVTKSQIAQATAKVLLDSFIIHYLLPGKILSDDQGRNFESELIANLCRLTGTKNLGPAPIIPQTIGQCERLRSTLIKMLRTLPPKCKSDCKGSIRALVNAYNCTHNSATGFSPYFLMYGREPWLATDSIATPTSSKYIYKLRDCIKWAYKTGRGQTSKQNYNWHSKAVSLRPGDTVLVCVTTFKGRHKIQSWWENSEYVVEWQLYPNLLVYVVHPIDVEGCSHILNRYYLLPISSNLEQGECASSVGEEGPSDEPTLILHASDALLVNHLTESQPESIFMCCQNRTNHMTQRWLGQPLWIPQTLASRMTPMHPFYWGKAQKPLGTNSPGSTIILHCSGITSFLVTLIFVLASASSFTSCHTCTMSYWGIQCKDTLFKPPQICLTQTIPDINGNTIHVNCMVGFWIGEWTKWYLLQVQLPHQRNQKDKSP